VQVNRVWQHLFGAGLVETTDNFGRSGTPPTHPELLEWLAARFVDGGYRLKPVLKTIMTSSVYRQASKRSDLARTPGPGGTGAAYVDPEATDPSNRLLWRMRLRRLESEVVRDSILVASGRLEERLGGPPVLLETLPDGMVVVKAEGPDPGSRQRRSLYLLARRNYHLSLLGVFDQPVVSTQCSCRMPSAVVSQSLTMMNDAWVLGEAERFADRVSALAPGPSPDEQIDLAFKIAFARPPSASEAAWCRGLLARQADPAENARAGRVSPKARALLCHALFNASEFIYAP
jgi:hypothetical protein